MAPCDEEVQQGGLVVGAQMIVSRTDFLRRLTLLLLVCLNSQTISSHISLRFLVYVRLRVHITKYPCQFLKNPLNH